MGRRGVCETDDKAPDKASREDSVVEEVVVTATPSAARVFEAPTPTPSWAALSCVGRPANIAAVLNDLAAGEGDLQPDTRSAARSWHGSQTVDPARHRLDRTLLLLERPTASSATTTSTPCRSTW